MSSYEPNHQDAFVIIHEKTESASFLNAEQSDKLGSVLLKRHPEEAVIDVTSYIGGKPNWVQDEITISDYHWALSIYGPDIDDALVENAGILSGGTLHVLLKDQIDFNREGVIGKVFYEL